VFLQATVEAFDVEGPPRTRVLPREALVRVARMFTAVRARSGVTRAGPYGSRHAVSEVVPPARLLPTLEAVLEYHTTRRFYTSLSQGHGELQPIKSVSSKTGQLPMASRGPAGLHVTVGSASSEARGPVWRGLR
jgi:hypothetical protein